ncbi:hypothetical protein SAMN02745671_01135 [Anaerovibrio lipolyticus DSM 3074]|uniref:Uncharacterized protein n=1 Tax=Anaerovibrio lipolyticus DSM 3074 TaxID=1120997 RepID=A0A1M6CJ17_9FIRM|nr:hypothetical protein [Anaerovibrio lipolyticus]SHI60986.1 hypothetical protein SAMN02745671_01135 [Anaerovibrio lipolyticus DSM 3074]
MKKTVADYISEYGIDINNMGIYDESIGDEIWRPWEIREYFNSVVVDVYEKDGVGGLVVACKE